MAELTPEEREKIFKFGFVSLALLALVGLPLACGNDPPTTTNNPTPTPTITATFTITPFPTPGLQGTLSVYSNNANLSISAFSGSAAATYCGKFSPDGTKVVYISGTNIVVSDALCSSPITTIAFSPLCGTWWTGRFCWSPDSHFIALSYPQVINCGGVCSIDIYVLKLSNLSFTNVTNTICEDKSAPAWSSTGKIAFYAGSPRKVYVMDSDGSNRSLIYEYGSSSHSPAWSPDGSMLAVHMWDMGIQILTSNGSPVTSLSINPEIAQPALTEGNLGWSPDGQWIGFLGDTNSGAQVFAVNVTTGELKQLTNEPNTAFLRSWY